jgi:hypothetical protein
MIVTDMAAVGLSGVFKYGGKFLGYVAAVVLAAGVFVGGGAFFAVTGGVNSSNPSLASLSTGRALLGVVLMIIGGGLSLAGLFGLAHKLLADAAAAARAAPATASQASTSETEADEEADDPEESTTEGETTESSTDEDDAPGTDAEPTDRPEQSPAGESPAPSKSPPDGTVAADGVQASRTDGTAQAGASTDDYVDESASDEDWTESKYATGTQPAADDDATGANGSAAQEEAQAEWTPPDPSEFEQSTPDDADEAAVEPSPAASSESSETPPAEDQGGDGDVRTWDDVRSASSGSGIEADRGSVDVDQSAPVSDEPTGAEDIVGGDEVPRDPVSQDGTRDPVPEDEPSFAGEESVEGSLGEDPAPAAGDETETDQEEDDDATLADEGVSSFEVEDDDDPLGDRLSGGD